MERTVYDLRGTAQGQVVYVVGGGAADAGFPLAELTGRVSVGLNGAAERFEPWLWLLDEAAGAERYRGLWEDPARLRRIAVVREAWDALHGAVPAEKQLYRLRGERPGDPRDLVTRHRFRPTPQGALAYWEDPRDDLLPGRCPEATALSLAVLLRARAAVLVGVDFSLEERREAAAWFSEAWHNGYWPIRLYAACADLSQAAGVEVPQVPVDQALDPQLGRARKVWSVGRPPGQAEQPAPEVAASPAAEPGVVQVICLKYGTKYGPEYVNRLARGVRHHTRTPHEFVCFTDDPRGLDPEVRVAPLPARDDGLRGWWWKLWFFSPEFHRDHPGRTVFLDLDTVVAGSLDFLLEYRGAFALLRDFYRREGYGSGVMCLSPGFGAHVWERFAADAPSISQRLRRGGDQAWIEEQVAQADRLQDLYGGRIVSYKAHCRGRPLPPEGAALICFHGHPNPHELPAGDPVRRLWEDPGAASTWRLSGPAGLLPGAPAAEPLRGRHVRGMGGAARAFAGPERQRHMLDLFGCTLVGTFNVRLEDVADAFAGRPHTLAGAVKAKGQKGPQVLRYWRVVVTCDADGSDHYAWAVRFDGSGQRKSVLELCSKEPLPDRLREGELRVRFVERWPVEQAQAWAYELDWRHRWFQGFAWLPPDLRRADSALLWRFLGERPFSGRTVLDYGCHDAFHALEASRRGARVLAVDKNDKVLAVARAINDHVLSQDVRFLLADDLPEGQWDVVLSLSMWHQVDPRYERLEEHIQALRERARELVFLELINPPLEGDLTQDEVDRAVARHGGRRLHHYRHQVRSTRTLYELPGAAGRPPGERPLPPAALEGRARCQEVEFAWVDEDAARVRALFAREQPACLVRAGDGELRILRGQTGAGPRLREGLARALSQADLVGLPRGHERALGRGRHSHGWDRALVEACAELGAPVDEGRSVSAVLFLLAPELLGELCRGRRVLLVNHGASRLVELLGRPDFRDRYGLHEVGASGLEIPDGVVYARGVQGEALDELVDGIAEQIRAQPPFDLCVLGAGAMAKPLALFVRDELGRHAVDVGALLSAMQGQRNRNVFRPGGAREHLVWTGR